MDFDQGNTNNPKPKSSSARDVPSSYRSSTSPKNKDTLSQSSLPSPKSFLRQPSIKISQSKSTPIPTPTPPRTDTVKVKATTSSHSNSILQGAGEGRGGKFTAVINKQNLCSGSTTTLSSASSSSISINAYATAINLSNDHTVDDGLRELLEWLDKIPISRSKKNLNRDFSDGVLMAEVVAHFFPKMIELHNYVPASAANLKKNNWELLNRKIFPKLGIKLQDVAIESICLAKPGFIEAVLAQMRKLIKKKSDEEAKAQEAGDATNQLPLKEETCFVHSRVSKNEDQLPEFVVYRGHKYIPEVTFNQIQKSSDEMNDKLQDLSNKVLRQQTLITLKENHLEDLTRQLHNARVQLGEITRECICKWDKGQQPPNCGHFN